MRIHHILTLAAALSLAPVSSARADVQIAMRDGLVTLDATGVTVREILAAWAKIGQTRIVNAERVNGGPVTLHFQDIPEEQALEIILRSVSGYLAAPRATEIANASRYDRIFVMPTSTPPRAAPTPPPPAFPQQQFNPAMQQQPPFNTDDDDPTVNPPPPGQRGPLFTFPQPGVVPQPVAVPPGMPPPVRPGPPPVRGGVAVPGMIAEPQQPAQPGTPPPQP